MKSKRLLNQLTLTSVVFLITQLALTLVLYLSNMSYSDSSVWNRWDSAHYLGIVKWGYTFFSCAGEYGFTTDSPFMCGNSGWFPGYPYLIKLLSFITTDIAFLGGLISKIFYFLSLLMVLFIVKVKHVSLKNMVYLLLPGFFFGFIYYNAIFPISATLFFSLLGFYAFLKRRWWLIGLSCFVVSFLYSTGFLLSFTIAFTIIIKENEKGLIEKLKKCLIPLSFGGMGVLLFFLILHLQVNDWSAFIQIQSRYEHGWHNPIMNVIKKLKSVPYTSYSFKHVIVLQSVLVIVGYLSLSIYFFIRKLFRSELHLLSYLYVTLFLIFPWVVGGDLSMYRAESLLLPAVFLLTDLKMPLKISILAVLISIGGVMSYLFFTNVLV